MDQSSYLNRAVLVLVAYDVEVLQITLRALTHTLDARENVVIVLNGKSDFASEYVERIARTWILGNQNRHVVKALRQGENPFVVISEILTSHKLFQNIEFICKIDDDIIPLKKGWLDELEKTYVDQKLNEENPFFVTGLINNNSWGFKKIVDLFDKQDEYAEINNYFSKSGMGLVQPGEIANGYLGTIWQYPYISYWLHQWTSLNIPEFIERTKNQGLILIDNECHYSIGCIFFSKDDWGRLESLSENTTFDELLIHKYCIKYNKTKWAILSEPMIHVFYHNQRIPNRNILIQIEKSLRDYFNDPNFEIQKYTTDENFLVLIEKLNTIERKMDSISDSLGPLRVLNKFSKMFRKSLNGINPK